MRRLAVVAVAVAALAWPPVALADVNCTPAPAGHLKALSGAADVVQSGGVLFGVWSRDDPSSQSESAGIIDASVRGRATGPGAQGSKIGDVASSVCSAA